MVRPKELKIEILDVYPSTLGHCPHYNLLAAEMAAAGAEFCELSSQALEYPDDVIRSHDRAVEIARFLKEEVRGVPVNVMLEMVSLVSPIGFLKGLRHWVLGRFAILVNGKKVCDGNVHWEKLREEVWRACQPMSTG